ncbi:MAG: rRNA maturation RNase YbeY [Gammaproteobacteria bacterium]|nr:rRNA maturation RNase YbeY [Gammaproteobacteria bacterium]
MKYQIEVQNALEPEPGPQGIPSEEKIIEWASAVLLQTSDVSGHVDEAEMTIRLVNEAEMSELNLNYRNKPGPTNVLSFPADVPEEIDLPLLGDVIICAEVVSDEARAQNKPLETHWAHMIVHGTLHLLGYDHMDDEQADEMENKEIEILAKFGYPNPYMVINKI